VEVPPAATASALARCGVVSTSIARLSVSFSPNVHPLSSCVADEGSPLPVPKKYLYAPRQVPFTRTGGWGDFSDNWPRD